MYNRNGSHGVVAEGAAGVAAVLAARGHMRSWETGGLALNESFNLTDPKPTGVKLFGTPLLFVLYLSSLVRDWCQIARSLSSSTERILAQKGNEEEDSFKQKENCSCKIRKRGLKTLDQRERRRDCRGYTISAAAKPRRGLDESPNNCMVEMPHDSLIWSVV
ncbi:hypothetical protein VNO78_35138 [Psophocarpus tetragonolobus]|uniref:Uncharacterized protein n=1 Tax=Psophocarpus tetragonolobus TaxID=3891 RepID=A0AAN9NMQ4_PSOTE